MFKDFVIKIPNTNKYRLFLHGILANLQEKRFSKTNRPDLAKVKFCDCFGIVLIMEKAEVLNNENTDLKLFKKTLKSKYKNDKMKSFMLSDLDCSNWGYRNDMLVKIDYGN